MKVFDTVHGTCFYHKRPGIAQLLKVQTPEADAWLQSQLHQVPTVTGQAGLFCGLNEFKKQTKKETKNK